MNAGVTDVASENARLFKNIEEEFISNIATPRHKKLLGGDGNLPGQVPSPSPRPSTPLHTGIDGGGDFLRLIRDSDGVSGSDAFSLTSLVRALGIDVMLLRKALLLRKRVMLFVEAPMAQKCCYGMGTGTCSDYVQFSHHVCLVTIQICLDVNLSL